MISGKANSLWVTFLPLEMLTVLSCDNLNLLASFFWSVDLSSFYMVWNGVKGPRIAGKKKTKKTWTTLLRKQKIRDAYEILIFNVVWLQITCRLVITFGQVRLFRPTRPHSMDQNNISANKSTIFTSRWRPFK